MKTLLRLLASLIFLIAFATAAHAQPDVKHAKMADTLLKQKRFSEAIGYYDKAIQANGKEHRYLYRRGLARMAMGQLDKAKDDYFAALVLNPDCEECYFDLGTIELANGNPRAALGFLNSAIKLKKSAMSYFSRAQAREALGDNIEALIDYNYAIQFDSTFLPFRLAKGQYYLNTKNVEMALEIFNDVIARAPDSTAGYYQRAMAYYAAEKWEKALADIDRAIALDKTINSDAYMARGTALVEMKRFADARANYDTLIAHRSDYGLAYFYRGMSRYKLEDMDGSCDDLHKSLALMRKNDPKNQMIGYAEQTIGNHCDTSRPSYYYQRGIGLYNLNRFDEAIAAYDKGLARFKEYPLFHYFRGNANIARKHFAEAIKDYNRALADEKDLMADYVMSMGMREGTTPAQLKMMGSMMIIGIHEEIAKASVEVKDFDGALAAVNREIEMMSLTGTDDAASGYLNRGVVYFLKGENRKALEDFDRVIEKQPTWVVAHMNRAVALADIVQHRPITTTTTSFFFNVPGQGNGGGGAPMRFELPPSVKRTDNSEEIRQAIAACNRVIELDPTFAQAYGLRGLLRLMTGSPEACDDLRKAESLGSTEGAALIKENCK